MSVLSIIATMSITWHMLIIQGELPIERSWQTLRVEEHQPLGLEELEDAIDLLYPDPKKVV